MAWSLKPERKELAKEEDGKTKPVGYIYEKTSKAKKKLSTIFVRPTIEGSGGSSELKSKLEDDDFEFPEID